MAPHTPQLTPLPSHTLTHTHTTPRQDCDYIRRAELLPSLPWAFIPQLKLLHPIHGYLPQPAALSEGVRRCMAGAAPPAAAFAAAVTEGLATMLHRARSPSAWEDFPASDRHYYARKWGGLLNRCGGGEYGAPFGVEGTPLGAWERDVAMRRATVAGTAIEGLLPPV